MTRSKKLFTAFVILTMLFANIAYISPDAAVKRPARVTGVKATKVASNSVRLSWKKAKRAKRYSVYIKKGKKLKRLKTTKKRSVVIKKLAVNKTYKFKVRAYNFKHKKKRYGKFSKYISVRIRKQTNAQAVDKKTTIPKGVAQVPELTVNGKTIKVGDPISSVNSKFKLARSGISDVGKLGKYPWNVYEPYSDNFLMVRVKDSKVWGFYTSSRKFSCKIWDKTIKFGDSYSTGQTFWDENMGIEVGGNIQLKYHTISLVVNSIYYDADTGEMTDGENYNADPTKTQLSGAEVIAEYTFNQLRYNEGKEVLDTSQNTTAGKVCKRWANDWIPRKPGPTHNGETTATNFINDVIKKEFPDFPGITPIEVCMATTKNNSSGGSVGIDCGTIYANCNSKEKASPGHYADVIKMSLDYNVLSISIGKDPGGKYALHSIAAFM